MRVSLVLEWRDLWIGLYVDRRKKRLYMLPVPCFGLLLDWSRQPDPARCAACGHSLEDHGGTRSHFSSECDRCSCGRWIDECELPEGMMPS